MSVSRRSVLEAAGVLGAGAILGGLTPEGADASPTAVQPAGTAWPMFRHGPARTGVAVESTITAGNVAGLRLTKTIGLGRALSEFTVEDSSGVVILDDYGFISRQIPSLTFLWRRRVGKFNVNLSAPAIDAGLAYSTSSGISAAKLSNGSLVWSVSPSNIQDCVGSPAVSAGLLYLTCRDGTVAALDKRNGNVRWRVGPTWHDNLQGDLWSSPAIWQGKVFVATEKLGCFDALTGVTKFAVPLPLRAAGNGDYSLQPPSVAGGFVMVPSYLGLTAFDASTGGVVWKTSIGDTNPVAVSDGRVFAQSPQGLKAFSASTGQVLWSVPFSSGSQRGFCGVTFANGVVFATVQHPSSMYQCYGHSAADGTLLWTSQISQYATINGVVISNGRLYLTNSSGDLSLYETS